MSNKNTTTAAAKTTKKIDDIKKERVSDNGDSIKVHVIFHPLNKNIMAPLTLPNLPKKHLMITLPTTSLPMSISTFVGEIDSLRLQSPADRGEDVVAERIFEVVQRVPSG